MPCSSFSSSLYSFSPCLECKFLAVDSRTKSLGELLTTSDNPVLPSSRLDCIRRLLWFAKPFLSQFYGFSPFCKLPWLHEICLLSLWCAIFPSYWSLRSSRCRDPGVQSDIPNSLPDTCRRLYLPGPPDGNFWLQPAPSVFTAIKFNGYRLTQVEEGDTTQTSNSLLDLCQAVCAAGDATCQVESGQTPTHDPHPGPWKGMTKRQRLSPPETQSANIVPILAQLLVRHHLHSRLSTVYSSNAITENVHRLARTQSSNIHWYSL